MCAEARCGDRIVEGTEFCDDGVNAGSKAGDCASDCSAIVTTKRIVKGQDAVRTDFARNGVAQLLATVDANCPAGYKAMFSDGQLRIATVTPNKGDGQKNWVLRPWTRYVNANAEEIWTTTAVALLGISSGGIQRALFNPIVPGSAWGYITGMNPDWTTLGAGKNCEAWTAWTASAQMQFGAASNVSTEFLRAGDSAEGTFVCNSSPWTLYCVEQ
ncbi:MAG TPA: DUF1554 domain-containing protein [Polyangiaceae bacterium]|nr:DUF1554 domain-containing protein [Polyangiaceae bacterium]